MPGMVLAILISSIYSKSGLPVHTALLTSEQKEFIAQEIVKVFCKVDMKVRWYCVQNLC